MVAFPNLSIILWYAVIWVSIILWYAVMWVFEGGVGPPDRWKYGSTKKYFVNYHYCNTGMSHEGGKYYLLETSGHQGKYFRYSKRSIFYKLIGQSF